MMNTMRICSSAEMREIDLIAERDYGIHANLLMENAGRAAAQTLLENFPNAGRNTEILIFAGKGNNAGDAFVVARRLICLDRRVRVFHLQHESGYKGAVFANFEILKKMKAKLVHIETASVLDEFFQSSPGPFTIVDGILGTGLKAKLEGIYYDIVEMINAVNAPEVVALDIPTGVNGDSGAIHETSILANLTISFGFPKLGHFLPPGAARRGELINVDISLPPRFKKEGDKFLLLKNPMSALIRERDRYGHKNAFGHTLLVGGSPGRVGAITMAARACHKMGTGLVTVASWLDSFEALMTKLPDETMAVPLHLNGRESEFYKENLSNYSSIIIGPGLGLRPEGKLLLEEILSIYSGPIVLDADALNLVSEYQLHEAIATRKAPTVLTPHPGEMSRLLSQSKEDIQQDSIQAVRKAVALTHATVLLKGAATLIGSTEDTLYLNHYPNDGMATAGSGDVLAGMIGGLLGQKMDPFQATLLGVYLHSLAGDFAAKSQGHRSMTAPDIIENIGNAFKDIKTVENIFPMEARIHLL
jgi:NAD(P)H-hydrate epimerase